MPQGPMAPARACPPGCQGPCQQNKLEEHQREGPRAGGHHESGKGAASTLLALVSLEDTERPS